jgi:hypothetical protein
MALYCRFCGLEKFRTSRFRFRPSDLGRLLLLKLPVRCLNCDQRTYTSIQRFLKLRRQFKMRGE